MTGTACKHPGNPKFYHFTFCFENTHGGGLIGHDPPIQITVDSVTKPVFGNLAIVVPAGQKVCKYVDAGLFGSSQQGSGHARLRVHQQAARRFQDRASTAARTALPPCGTGCGLGNNPSDDPPHVPDGRATAQCLPK